MVIPDKAHGLYGFHHVYVEPKTAQARTPRGCGWSYPSTTCRTARAWCRRGALRSVAVMQRDSSAKDTGGWRWAMFDPTGKAMTLDVKAACFTCHVPTKDRADVFSEWVEHAR
jgi:hypothetical protein